MSERRRDLSGAMSRDHQVVVVRDPEARDGLPLRVYVDGQLRHAVPYTNEAFTIGVWVGHRGVRTVVAESFVSLGALAADMVRRLYLARSG